MPRRGPPGQISAARDSGQGNQPIGQVLGVPHRRVDGVEDLFRRDRDADAAVAAVRESSGVSSTIGLSMLRILALKLRR